MARRKQTKASELKGMNIYQDPKHGTVYYDWLTRKGYQLTTSDVKWYQISQGFLPIAVIVAYVCNVLIHLTLSASIIIGLIAYVLMKMVFRLKFLNTLPFVENYKKSNKDNIFQNAAKNYSKQRLAVLAILAVALVGCTIAYILLEKPTGTAMIGMYVLLIAAVAMAIYSIVALIIKKKND